VVDDEDDLMVSGCGDGPEMVSGSESESEDDWESEDLA
jgi:hypothetical protein